MSLIFPIDAKLKDGSPVQLALADERNVEPLRRLYRVFVEEGTSYPNETNESGPFVLCRRVRRDATSNEIGDGLSSVSFSSLRRKEFPCFGGDRHEHRRRDAEPFGELGDLADVQVALAR